MCTVSNVGDGYRDTFPQRYSWYPFDPTVPNHQAPSLEELLKLTNNEEIQKLRAEIVELKKLLAAAKKFDESTGQKDCEMDSKVAFLKQVAEAMGVDLSDVFRN